MNPMYTIYLAAIALLFTIAYTLGKIISQPKGETCNMTVKSIDTGYEYHATRYVLKENTMDLQIYNYHTRKYEWYPVYHFKNPFLIVFTITHNLELAYRIGYGVNPKNFTNGK